LIKYFKYNSTFYFKDMLAVFSAGCCFHFSRDSSGNATGAQRRSYWNG